MPNLKYLAEELGTDVETIRQVSNVGDYPEDFRLTPAQEANVRNSWSIAQNAGQLPTPVAAEAPAEPQPE